MIDAYPWISRNATSAKKAPRSLAIIGDGAVECEMAHAWYTLGTKEVTIISKHKKILDKYEPIVGEQLAEAFKQRGMSIYNNVMSEVKRIKNNNKQEQENGDLVQIMLDECSTLSSEEISVDADRKPNTDALGFETVGLKPRDWLEVDVTCLVNGVEAGGDSKWLYAVGDINHRALLTHVGKYQGRACSRAIIRRLKGSLDIYNNNNHDNFSGKIANNRNRNVPRITNFTWLATSDHMTVSQVIFLIHKLPL